MAPMGLRLVNDDKIFQFAAIAGPESIDSWNHKRFYLILVKAKRVVVVLDFFNEVSTAVADFDVFFVLRKRRKAQVAVTPWRRESAKCGILENSRNRIYFGKPAQNPNDGIGGGTCRFYVDGINAVCIGQKSEGISVVADGNRRGFSCKFGKIGLSVGIESV